MCHLFRGSTVHKEEDNLSIVDKNGWSQCVLYSDVPLYNTAFQSILDLFIGIFPAPAPSPDQVTIGELLAFPQAEGTAKLNITQEIGTKYYEFGALLLGDTSGSRISSLEKIYGRNAEHINMKVLQEWLSGGGKQPVSWKTLVSVLEDCGLTTLVDSITSVKLKNDLKKVF